VTAIQNGSAIFDLVASFHARQEGPEHQLPMPDVPMPEDLRPELDLIREAAERIPEPLRRVLTQDRPIDFRPVAPLDPLDPRPSPPAKHLWFRALGGMPSDALVHQAVLAYASDYGLLGTVLQPHAISIRSPRIQVASLDHALWFHRSFRVDEWLLYAMDSPAACGGRGFARGSIFTREGTLVASVAQEGLTRWSKTSHASRG
jgi:acyl-CoA thioesterase-2